MSDPSRSREPGEGLPSASPPGMPRWVKRTVIVIAVLIVLFVVLQLAGVGGKHGPGRHGAGTGVAPATSITATHIDGWDSGDRGSWGKDYRR